MSDRRNTQKAINKSVEEGLRFLQSNKSQLEQIANEVDFDDEDENARGFISISPEEWQAIRGEAAEEMTENFQKIGYLDNEGNEDDLKGIVKKKRPRQKKPEDEIQQIAPLLLMGSNTQTRRSIRSLKNLPDPVGLKNLLDASIKNNEIDELQVDMFGQFETNQSKDPGINTDTYGSAYLNAQQEQQKQIENQEIGEDFVDGDGKEKIIDDASDEDVDDKSIDQKIPLTVPINTVETPATSFYQHAQAKSGIRILTDAIDFFLIDVQEPRLLEGRGNTQSGSSGNSQLGILFLFGRMHDTINRELVSASVRVEGIKRNLYFLPRPQLMDSESGEITKPSLRDVEKEVRSAFSSIKSSGIEYHDVIKQFPFDGVDEAPDEGEYLSVIISASIDLSNIKFGYRTYAHIFGLGQKLNEVLLVGSKIIGPSWIRLFGAKMMGASEYGQHMNTYSERQLLLKGGQQSIIPLSRIENEQVPPPPPLRLMSLSIQTWLDEGTKEHEIIMATAFGSVHILPDGQKTGSNKSEQQGRQSIQLMPQHFYPLFSFVSQPSALKTPLPQKLKEDFKNRAAEINRHRNSALKDEDSQEPESVRRLLNGDKKKFFGSAYDCKDLPNEMALLSALCQQIHSFDPDFIVGHNLLSGVLGLVVHRLSRAKQAASRASQGRTGTMLSKPAISTQAADISLSFLGRIKRNFIPSIGASGTNIEFAVQSFCAGRLLCDTLISAKEFRREKSYTLTELAQQILGKTVEELDPVQIPICFQDNQSLLWLLGHTEDTGLMGYQMMEKMNIIPLTKQLANITGTLWGRVLLGGRAERVENLLVHTFSQQKPQIIIPDKFSNRKKDSNIQNGVQLNSFQQQNSSSSSQQSSSLTQHTQDIADDEAIFEADSIGDNIEADIDQNENEDDDEERIQRDLQDRLIDLQIDKTIINEGNGDGNNLEVEEQKKAPLGSSLLKKSSRGKQKGKVGQVKSFFSKPNKSLSPKHEGIQPLNTLISPQKGIANSKSNQQQQHQQGIHPRRKKAAYKGGFVLDAKSGFYDNYILLLDFNSLYPSIIREKNICFTTIPRGEYKEEETLNIAISNDQTAVLPSIVRKLIEQRKDVKGRIKNLQKNLQGKDNNKSDEVAIAEERIAVLNTEQLAYKLVANSMYGCLGFEAGRFYAKRLAQMITWYGRKLLSEACDIVKKQNHEVIYGDTDSIMISIVDRSLSKVILIGNQLCKLINKGKDYLKIDIDGIFSSLLLLRKKKYAAMKMQTDVSLAINRPKDAIFKMEVRGLELVRRDWCGLTHQAEEQLLRIMLGKDGPSKFEINVTQIESSQSQIQNSGSISSNDDSYILESEDKLEDEYQHSVGGRVEMYLRNLAAHLRAGEGKVNDFIITKGIFKDPSEYPNANHQPHVLVALEMRGLGMSVQAGMHIPYIICKGDGQWASRAHHPSLVEVKLKIQQQEQLESGMAIDRDDDAPQTSSETQLNMEGNIEIQNSTIQTPLKILANKAQRKAKYEPDIDWYFAQQIHPAVLRLCECVEGMNAMALAEFLGMDTTRYRDTRRIDGSGIGSQFYRGRSFGGILSTCV